MRSLLFVIALIAIVGDLASADSEDTNVPPLISDDVEAAASSKPVWYRQPLFYKVLLLEITGTLVMKPQTALLGAKAARIGVSSQSMGTILALMPLTSAVVSPIAGKNLVRIGLRRTLVFGALATTLTGTSFCLLDFVEGAEFVAAAATLRAVFGASVAVSSTALSCYWNLSYDNFSTVQSVSMATSALLGMLVPPICTLIDLYFGQYMPFVVVGGFATALVLVCSRSLPSFMLEPPAPSAGASSPSMMSLLRLPRSLAALLVLTANMAASGLIGVLLPYLFADNGISELAVGISFSISGLAWSSGLVLSGRMIDAWGFNPRRIMEVYGIMVMLILVMLTFARTPIIIVATIALLSFSTSVSQLAASNLLISETLAASPSLVPLIGGLKVGGRTFGEAFGNIVGGVLYNCTNLSMTGVSFAALCAAALLVYEVNACWCAWRESVPVIDDQLTIPLVQPGPKPETLFRRGLQKIKNLWTRNPVLY